MTLEQENEVLRGSDSPKPQTDRLNLESLELMKSERLNGSAGSAQRDQSLLGLGFPSGETLLASFGLEGSATKQKDTKDQKDGGDKKGTPFQSEKATAVEIEFLKKVASPEQIEKVKGEINRLGKDPHEAVLDATKDKKNRVIGLGEWHSTPNGLRTLAQTMMGDFKKEGITHLAVEVQDKDQNMLDRLAKGEKAAGEELKKIYGNLGEDWVRMISEAAAKGIKLVAVDSSTKPTMEEFARASTRNSDSMQKRDSRMSENIAGILKSDEKARVLFVVGSAHLEKGTEHKSAATHLQDKGYAIATFGAHMEGESENITTPTLVKSLSRSVAIETGKTEELKRFPLFTGKDSTTLGRHDFALFLPQNSALKFSEQAHGKDSPKILPELEELTKAKLGARNMADSAPLIERTTDLAKKKFGEQSREVAELYERFGHASKGDQAANFYLESMAIREKLDDRNAYGRAAGLVVRVNEESGNSKEAAKYFNQAAEHLTNQKNNSAEGIKSFLIYTSNFGNILRTSDDTAEYTKVLENLLALKGKIGASTFDEHRSLADIYNRQKQPKEAEKHYLGALESASSDTNLFRVRRDFGNFLETRGLLDEAEKHRRANLDLFGKDKQDFFSANTDLARNLEKQKKDNQAEEIYRSAMKSWEKGVTIDNPGEVNIEFLTSYAAFLKRTGKNDEAAQIDEKAQFSQLMYEGLSPRFRRESTESREKKLQQAMPLWERGASNEAQGRLYLQEYAKLLEFIEKHNEARRVTAKLK